MHWVNVYGWSMYARDGRYMVSHRYRYWFGHSNTDTDNSIMASVSTMPLLILSIGGQGVGQWYWYRYFYLTKFQIFTDTDTNIVSGISAILIPILVSEFEVHRCRYRWLVSRARVSVSDIDTNSIAHSWCMHLNSRSVWWNEGHRREWVILLTDSIY